LRDKNNFPEKCRQLFDQLTSSEFVEKLSIISGYELINDDEKMYWGIHKYGKGDYLDIHVDAGISPITGLKKQVTLGIYLSKNWKDENGGCLELWSGDNAGDEKPKIYEKKIKIVPLFNRLILFTCNDYSWHGNPDPIYCADEETRIFTTVSYMSKNFIDRNIKKKAYFIGRPSDPIDKHKDDLRLLRSDHEKCKQIYSINTKKM
jgi:Rps23 Pro-64 3,4-dihydroxylase Tpa1-like proline 4-hydroxylase